MTSKQSSQYKKSAILKAQGSDWSGALLHYNIAINSWPEEAMYGDFLQRGEAKYFTGDLTGAVEDYTKAIQLKVDFASAYLYRGIAKYYLKDKDGAILDYEYVKENYPLFISSRHGEWLNELINT